MKRLINISSIFWLVPAIGLVLALAGCGGITPTPVSTQTPVQDPPATQVPATIRGTITYQAPPTPISMLYIISPEHWYSLEVPTGDPASTFEMQVAPGTYQLVAFPKGTETQAFRPAAAYTTGSGISPLTVTGGQVAEGIRVQNVNSDRCISVPFPASPDGLFPPIEENCSKLPTEEAQATIRGTITYQGMPTPTSMLYLISPERWYSIEVVTGTPASTFETQVAPGTYQIVAFPKGSENQASRPSAAYSTGSGIGLLTVTAGQIVEGIKVKNINSDRCISVPFPASPDGLFPAIEEDCSKLPTEVPQATIGGTISYQAPPTPNSMLYIISPERWYSMELPSGSPVSTFEMQVAPGTYQLVAFPVGSENQAFRPAAAYSTGSGIGLLTVTAGQVLEDIKVKNINSDRCISVPFPASPDGRFPAIEENCSKLPTEVPQATIRGTITYQAPPTPLSVLYIISPERWYSMEVPSGSPVSTFEMQVAPGTYQLIAFPAGSENQSPRGAAAYTTGSGIGFLTVAAGEVWEGIRVQNVNSDRCISVPFPASPDGRFPAIEVDCN